MLELALDDSEWESVALRGLWFLESFEGPMANLQPFIAGEDSALISLIADACRTMALVEAFYESTARGATPVARID